MLNDAMFKALFRSVEARDMVVDFLNKTTGISKELLRKAKYVGGEIPKRKIKERNKTADVIVRLEGDATIIVEMNQCKTNKIFEKNTSYAFGVALEETDIGKDKYQKVYLINLDNFNKFNVKDEYLEFKIRDKYGHIESEMYNSIHFILENINDKTYNISEEISNFIKFIKEKDINKLKERFEGSEKFMAAIRKVEDLSSDPEFIGYYDIEEAHKWELEDMKQTGFDEGLVEGKKETAKKMIEEKIDINTIIKVTGLTKEELDKLK